MNICEQCNASNLMLVYTDTEYNELHYRCNCSYNDHEIHGYFVLVDSKYSLIKEISIGYESLSIFFYPRTTSIYSERDTVLIKMPFNFKFEANIDYITKIVNKIESNLMFL